MSKNDEDYLDNLLKTMGQNNASSHNGKSALEKLGRISPDDVADLLADDDSSSADETSSADSGEQRPGIDDISDMSEEDIDNLMNSAKKSADDALIRDEERSKKNAGKDITELDGIDDDSDTSEISELLKASDNNIAADDSISELLKKSQENEGDHGLTADDIVADDKLNLDSMITKAESSVELEPDAETIKEGRKSSGLMGKLSGLFGGKRNRSSDDKAETDSAEKKAEAKKTAAEKKAKAKKAAAEKKAEAKKAVAEKKAEAKKAAAEKKAEAKKAAAQKKEEAKKTAVQKKPEAKKTAVQKKSEAKKTAVQKKTDDNKGIDKSSGEDDELQENSSSDGGKSDDIEALIKEMNEAADDSESTDENDQNNAKHPDNAAPTEQDLVSAAAEVTHENNEEYMTGTEPAADDNSKADKESDDSGQSSVEPTDMTGDISGEIPSVSDDTGTSDVESVNKDSNEKKGTEPEPKAKGKNGIKGIIAKFLAFINADDDDDEEKTESDGTPKENISEENQQVLDEVNAEENAEGKKGKKSKKDKKLKKGKKGKGEPAADSGEEAEGEEGSGESGKGAKKKKKKEKKKKTKEPEVTDEKNSEEKLSKKRIRLTVIFAVTLTVCIMVLCYVVPMQLTLRRARVSFEKEDYESAYEELYGRKLNTSDQEIYDKSSMILQVERKYKSYESDKKMGKKLEGLDSLIQGVAKYNSLKDQADSYGILDKIKGTYDKIIKALKDDYGVSEKKANEIVNSKDDLTYTRSLYDVLGEEMPGDTSKSTEKTQTKDTSVETKTSDESVKQNAEETESGTGSTVDQTGADQTAENESKDAGTAADGTDKGESESTKKETSNESVMYIIHTK